MWQLYSRTEFRVYKFPMTDELVKTTCTFFFKQRQTNNYSCQKTKANAFKTYNSNKSSLEYIATISIENPKLNAYLLVFHTK